MDRSLEECVNDLRGLLTRLEAQGFSQAATHIAEALDTLSPYERANPARLEELADELLPKIIASRR